MNNPLVSIVVPTFNSEKFLAETLKSIYSQEYLNWECLIIDDRSSDSTLSIIKLFCEKDRRFQFYERPLHREKGPSACRNFGVEQSNGDYLIFLDSDDIMASTCLKKRVSSFIKFPDKDFIVFSMGIFEKFGDFKKDKNRMVFQSHALDTLKKFLGNKYPWNTSRPIFRKNIIEKVNGFNENLTAFEDPEMGMRILLLPNVNYKTVDQTDCYYRWDEDHEKKISSVEYKISYLENYYKMFESLFSKFNEYYQLQLSNVIKLNLIKFISEGWPSYNREKLKKLINLFYENCSFSTREKIYIYLLLEISLRGKPTGTYRISKKIKSYFENINN